MAEISKGRGYSKKDLVKHGHPIILYGSLYTDFSYSITNVTTYVKRKENSVLSTGCDVIVPTTGETAEDISRASAVESKGIIIGSDLMIVNPPNNILPVFLALILSNGQAKRKLRSKAQGASIVHLQINDLSTLYLLVPSVEEQTNIVGLIKKLTKLITLYKRKLELLEEMKSYLLDVMFADEETKVPELRFDGFDGKWKKVRVKDIFDDTRGKVLAKPEIYESKSNEYIYPVYSSQTSNNGLMGYYNKYLFEDAITWTTDGANAGTVNYREGKFYSTNVNGVLLSNEGYANYATAEILNKECKRHVLRVGNPKLMNQNMIVVKMIIPEINEQMKISELIKQMNKTNKLINDKIVSFESVKTFLLDNLFV